MKREKPVIIRMLQSRYLFYFLASLNTALLAVPSESKFPPTSHGNNHSKEKRSSASLMESLTDATNVTLPTISFLEYNSSSNAEPAIICHINPPLPAPPIWGHVDLVECGLLIMTLLADDSADLHASQWSPTYPLVLPWTWGLVSNCQIQISAVNPASSDVFQRVMIAQRAALIVRRCVNNKGGVVSLGPREQFRITMFAFPYQATV